MSKKRKRHSAEFKAKVALAGLSIWWNLNILRDHLRKADPLNRAPWHPVWVSGAYTTDCLSGRIPMENILKSRSVDLDI